METIDNINVRLGDSLKQTIQPGTRLRVAASCFSMFAYEALKEELEMVDSVEFVFTSPTFSQGLSTDKIPKEKREFFIPKLERERSLFGTEFRGFKRPAQPAGLGGRYHSVFDRPGISSDGC